MSATPARRIAFEVLLRVEAGGQVPELRLATGHENEFIDAWGELAGELLTETG